MGKTVEKMKANEKEKRVFVEIEYEDETSFSFDVILHSESENSQVAEIMMITRGTLMASSAKRARAYNPEGFVICAYIR